MYVAVFNSNGYWFAESEHRSWAFDTKEEAIEQAKYNMAEYAFDDVEKLYAGVGMLETSQEDITVVEVEF